jgi:hypothetical protein
MPLDFNIQLPRWLQGEIEHLHNDDDATKVVTTGVALGSALLHQKEQREALATHALEQQRTQQDMDELPVWMAQHPNATPQEWSTRVTRSPWGAQTKQAGWMMSYQQQQVDAKKLAAQARADYEKGMVQNGSEQAKIDLDISKKFTDGINSIPIETDEAAAAVKKILLMPRGPGGGPTPEAITALGQLKVKYPPATKPSAQTNEGKNIDLINRLKKVGDIEGATLIENILKARGHLGTDKAPGGKLSAVDASRMKEAEGDLKQANIELSKAQKAVDDADIKHKAGAQAYYNKVFKDREMAHSVLEDIRKKYETPAGSKPITAPSVTAPDKAKPDSSLSPDDFNNWLKKRQETTD